MADVMLINPRITSPNRARFPLSIMTLAAALEPKHHSTLIDCNLERDPSAAVVDALNTGNYSAAGLTVMGGPQVATAIEISRTIRDANPHLPIVWGGYFPTLYPDVALNSDYVDFAIRGQGEEAIVELIDALSDGNRSAISEIRGLSWKSAGHITTNQGREFSRQLVAPRLDYSQLPDPKAYLVKTFLGRRTVAHQAALGCRFRCTFCGVAAMFSGGMALPPADRLDQDLNFLAHDLGADSVQFYDHNFFDREKDMTPLLEVLAHHKLAWWCYARSDALVNLNAASWKLVRQSRLRMAYIGAETPNDAVLRSIRKGTRAEQTLEVARLCKENGVIPELSFMVAPPVDPEGETEKTFDFIRQLKRVNSDAEIIVYIHTPLPAECVPHASRLNLDPLVDARGVPIQFPQTPEEWTEKRWVDYACHTDAPWISDRLRRRISDFVTVLRCRFPTVQDTRSPTWAKATLRGLASWRYALRRYDRPWELNASHRLIGLMDPRVTSI